MEKKSWWQKALFDANSGTNESKPQSTTTTPSTFPNMKTSTRPIFPSTSTPTPAVDDGEIDESYINHLYDFMTKNNLPGPDYYEFANSLDEMQTELDGASEEKIFQMTYKVAYKQTLSVEQLLESGKKYIQLFKQHKREFDDYLNSEAQKSIGSTTNDNNQLLSSNQDSNKKIEELKNQLLFLQKQIADNNKKIEENNNFITSETQKLESKKFKFEKAFNVIMTKIEDDINKIKQYLKSI